MDFTENQSVPNQHSQSYSSARRHTNGNTQSKINQKINYDSELDLTHDESFNSIFVTDSSKTLEINEQNIPQDRTRTSKNSG